MDESESEKQNSVPNVKFKRRFLLDVKPLRAEDIMDPISILNKIIEDQDDDDCFSNDDEDELYQNSDSFSLSSLDEKPSPNKVSPPIHQPSLNNAHHQQHGRNLNGETKTTEVRRAKDAEGDMIIEEPRNAFRMFKCGKGNCSAIFSSLKGLTIHKLQRHKAPPITMNNEQNMKINGPPPLVRRIRSHPQTIHQPIIREVHTANLGKNGEILLKCAYCPRNFPNSQILKAHMTTHTRERNFPCPHCPKKFFQSSHLTVHIRTHTGEKPYSCRFCPAKFNSPSNCRVHEKTHLKGNEVFHCEECGIGFLHKSRLERHLRSRKHVHPGGVIPKIS